LAGASASALFLKGLTMTVTKKILTAIQETIQTGLPVKVDLREASAITGSGDGVGGRTYFDDAFAALRFANPIRDNSRVIGASGSSIQFVAKTGNAADSTNPWGYTVNPNTGSPNINTSIWQLPTRVISAQLPIRTAVMSDVNYLNETIVEDLMFEFAQIEGASMVLNNDQTGTTTTSTGGTNGLRGLNSYPSAGTSAFGTSGTAITNGLHSIATVTAAASTLVYADIASVANAFPPQYWTCQGNAWMMHPATIQTLRNLGASTAGAIKQFAENGDDDGGAVLNVFGFPVIANPNMSLNSAGNFPIYLACWPKFVTVADVEEMTIQAMEQTQAGFITLYAEKRLASTVRDPFAGVRLVSV
jgi:HK97 family phage major capsid protein